MHKSKKKQQQKKNRSTYFFICSVCQLNFYIFRMTCQFPQSSPKVMFYHSKLSFKDIVFAGGLGGAGVGGVTVTSNSYWCNPVFQSPSHSYA